MKNMRRVTIVFLLVSLLTCWTLPAFASDSTFKETFEDALYGGLTGALVGAAVMAFARKPGDHLDYIYYGGAGGVLVGATYGLLKSAKSLAQIENGRVKFAIPTIMPDIQEASTRGGQTLAFKAELLRGRF